MLCVARFVFIITCTSTLSIPHLCMTKNTMENKDTHLT